MAERKSRILIQKKPSLRYGFAYITLLLLALIWCSLFISVPFLAEGSPLSQKISGTIILFFSPVCHQAPERSFFLAGHPLAVCTRCTGIYGGFLMGVLMYPIFQKFGRGSPLPRWIFVTGILLVAGEILLSRLQVIHPNGTLRSLTGGILGCIAAFYVVPTVFELADLRHKT